MFFPFPRSAGGESPPTTSTRHGHPRSYGETFALMKGVNMLLLLLVNQLIFSRGGGIRKTLNSLHLRLLDFAVNCKRSLGLS